MFAIPLLAKRAKRQAAWCRANFVHVALGIVLLRIFVNDAVTLGLLWETSVFLDQVNKIVPITDAIRSLDPADDRLGLGDLFEDVLPEKNLLMIHSLYHFSMMTYSRFLSIDTQSGAVQQFLFDTSTNSEFSTIMRRIHASGNQPVGAEKLVVDIGAMDGITGSNSFNFITLGWNAVVVEPFPRHFQRLQQNLGRYLKSKTQTVQAVNAVVSDKDELHVPLALYGSNSKTSNTVVPQLNKNKEPVETISVRSYTPTQLAEDYNIPKSFAVLTVDAEGIDLSIVQLFLDAGFQPRFIILELRNDYVSFDQRPDIFIKTAGYAEMAILGSNVVWELQ